MLGVGDDGLQVAESDIRVLEEIHGRVKAESGSGLYTLVSPKRIILTSPIETSVRVIV